VLDNLLGTTNQIIITPNANGTYTLSTPQDLDTAADMILGTLTLTNTGLHLLDTNASHDLIIKPGSDLTADRTFTLTTGDAARTLTLTGDPTIGDFFDQAVKTSSSPTFAGLTVQGLAQIYGLNVVEKSASYTASSSDWGTMFVFTTGASGSTLTFPSMDASNQGYLIGAYNVDNTQLVGQTSNSDTIKDSSAGGTIRSTTDNHLGTRAGAFFIARVISATHLDVIAAFGSFEAY
jgi:hypothetical protein